MLCTLKRLLASLILVISDMGISLRMKSRTRKGLATLPGNAALQPRLHVFIATQLDQVAQTMLFKWAGNLGKLDSSKEIYSLNG